MSKIGREIALININTNRGVFMKFNAFVMFSSIFLTISMAGYSDTPTPEQFNVFTIGNIGTSANPYQADFEGIAGAAGNAYFQNFSLNTTGGQPGSDSLYTGHETVILNSQINNGGIEAGGNITTNGSSINGSISGGSNLWEIAELSMAM